jgi:hypothetical protein
MLCYYEQLTELIMRLHFLNRLLYFLCYCHRYYTCGIELLETSYLF